MGCNPCGKVFQEPQYNFPENKNQKVEITESFNNIQSLFEKNHKNLGELYNDTDFNSVIPKDIKDYISQHPLKKDPKSHTYEAKPIQFNNGNI